jgi:signal transduction histidine kinase/ActR/RegA family two-component response regulator
MHYLRILLVCLFSSPLGLLANHDSTIDSLTAILKNRNIDNSSKLDIIFKLDDADDKDAIVYLIEALRIAHEMKDFKKVGNIHQRIGMRYDAQLKYDSAIVEYTQAEMFFEKEKLLKEKAIVINLRGISYEYKSDYKQALTQYYKSLRIFQDIQDTIGIGNQMLNIGLINQYQNNDSIAEVCFLQAISLFRKKNYTYGIGAALNNLGIHYKKKNDFKRALSNYKLVLDIDKSLNDSISMSYTLNNLGSVYESIGDYHKAYSYYTQSASIKLLRNDIASYTNTLNNMGSSLIGIGQYDKAKIILDSSQKLILQYGIYNNLAELYLNLHRYAISKSDYKLALDYYKSYVDVKDSIIKAETNYEIDRLREQYEIDNLNKELGLKKKIIEEQKYRKQLYKGVIIILLLIAVYFLYLVLNRKQLNKQLKDKNKDVEERNILLEDKNKEVLAERDIANNALKVKEQFLSVMSHEIRTPLNAITSMIYILAQSKLNEEQKSYAKILQDSADNLLALTNDVLDLSKIESGSIKIVYVPINLKQIVENIYKLYEVKAIEKGIQLDLKFDTNIVKELMGDPIRLNQVLSNLVSNAIKFTNKGVVIIKVNLIADIDNSYEIQFEIEDTGIGIAPEKQQLIFESFEQAEYNTTRKYGGTGLGLSISKKILELLHSKINVVSELNVGSTFSFIIKLPHLGTFNEGNESFTSEKGLENLRVLLVEDNKVNVFVIKKIFENWGVNLFVALNGKHAINMLLDVQPNIVLMDINMPEMDGYEAAAEILKQLPNLPIIALSATYLKEESIQQKMKDCGMKDFMMKPFNPDELKMKLLKYSNQETLT